MHTTVAWSESALGDSTFQKLAAVSDQHIKTYGDKIYVSNNNYIIGAYAAMNADAEEARLVSPSLRRVNPFYINPVQTAIKPTGNESFSTFPLNPVKLEPNEALEAEGKAGATTVQRAVVVLLAPGAVPKINGEIWTINANCNVAQVLNTWEYAELTFPDSLPVGTYDIVGAKAVVAGGIAFRLVPVGEPFRPGGICCADVGAKCEINQRNGGLGKWCSFNTVQPPGIEILGSAAVGAADYEIYLDVIKR